MNEPGPHHQFYHCLPISMYKNYGNLTSFTNSTSNTYLLLYILKSVSLGSMLHHFCNTGSEIFYDSSVTTATGYRLDDWSSVPWISLFCTKSRCLCNQSTRHWRHFLFYIGVNSGICQCQNYKLVKSCPLLHTSSQHGD